MPRKRCEDSADIARPLLRSTSWCFRRDIAKVGTSFLNNPKPTISNGAALVNQLMIESSLPNVRNYISGVSPLNVWQYDGMSFKAKGADNNYKVAVTPAKGKRLMNISGVKDELVPYEGGTSRAIPAKNGKLAFVAAEESTFVWARHMGYEGIRLVEPTRVDGAVEVFSYLDGDVVHCIVNNEGHGAVHGIPEKLLLEFLGVTQDPDERNNASHR